MLSTDVVVVGAGPAGVAASITLARAGRDVLLVDKARFPRDKCCGDGLTTGALRLLDDLGFRPDSVTTWKPVTDVWVRSPSGRTARFPLPDGPGTYAAVVPRRELDAALVDLAGAAGVKVADGHALRAAEAGRDRVVLEVEALGPVTARYAVGADGMWSQLRKALGAGVPGYLGDWHAFRQYASGVRPRAAEELWVWFDADLLPGYAWSFPLPDGRANVGFGVLRGAKVRTRDMKGLWPELLGRPHIRELLGPDATLEGVHKAWPIPTRVDRMPLTAGGGRGLFVGDAAAAGDPMTGEGIGQALLTGMLAGRAILAAGGLRPREAAARYTAAVERELVPDTKMSNLLVRALRHRKGARAAVRAAGVTPWTRRHFARWLFEDYPRGWIATPGRWREHSFTGPGAFRTGS